MVWILNSLILKVRLGLGIRQALLQTCEDSDFYIKTRLRQLHDRLVMNMDKRAMVPVDPQLREFNELLVECEQESHLTTERLINFRRKVEIHQDFKRRADQVLHQLRAQAYVLTALYIGLVTFVVWRFGFSEHAGTFVISMLLFTLGIVTTLRQGRRIKWTV
jgi:hypothetical protein